MFYFTPDHLIRPSDYAPATMLSSGRRGDQEPFGTAVPNQNPAGLGNFVYNPRFLGQYFDAEPDSTTTRNGL